MPRTKESSHTQPHLDRVQSGIRIAQSRIRDVQVTQFEAPVVFFAKNVRAQRGGRSEVDVVGKAGDIVVGEQGSATKFEEWREAAVPLEIPLKPERAEAQAIGGVRWLKDDEYGNHVDSIFEASAKDAGKMGFGEDPSKTHAGVKDAGSRGAARYGMAASGPQLNFVSPRLGRNLGPNNSGSKEKKNGKYRKTHELIVETLRLGRELTIQETEVRDKCAKWDREL